MKRAAACLALFVGFAAGPVWASSIGVYFAADGSDCDATIGLNEAFTFYILADLYYDDVAAAGITGAEFWVRNWPPAWSSVFTPNPAANIHLGNPLGLGCNIAFPGCQAPDANGFVLLYTIDAVATTPVSNLTLVVFQHGLPSGPNFECPLVTLCDAPIWSKFCVGRGQAFINGPTCNVAVTPATWGTVKNLYGS